MVLTSVMSSHSDCVNSLICSPHMAGGMATTHVLCRGLVSRNALGGSCLT